ncbi:MAG: D-alanine--D-alanine ligase, partial [Nitrosopumilaceae archaeon]|nr:D-alanine--D-alanine ligase [Nitrosopumilaceae archaeon]NIU88102.1 D-alanine--D-alanine ligase [Nitrosopumilaceae archaeon]NIV66347.1 D-alanine--D-alanine ligase [Nitrosopumilaceae archaeon]NIX62300.1 D-alanine--D-alanine ligase [Nitrosopumilaceae archaeon]
MVETSWNEELIDRTVNFVKELGYTGIGEAEYKYDSRNGEHKLLEINVRSTNQNRFIPYLGA